MCDEILSMLYIHTLGSSSTYFYGFNISCVVPTSKNNVIYLKYLNYILFSYILHKRKFDVHVIVNSILGSLVSVTGLLFKLIYDIQSRN